MGLLRGSTIRIPWFQGLPGHSWQSAKLCESPCRRVHLIFEGLYWGRRHIFAWHREIRIRPQNGRILAIYRLANQLSVELLSLLAVTAAGRCFTGEMCLHLIFGNQRGLLVEERVQVFGDIIYRKCRKAPAFRHGDIRHTLYPR